MSSILFSSVDVSVTSAKMAVWPLSQTLLGLKERDDAYNSTTLVATNYEGFFIRTRDTDDFLLANNLRLVLR